MKILGKIGRKIKWIIQKICRGYSDEDLFSLDDTISRFILPRLKAFRECPGGYNDCYFNNMDEWVACIDKMIRAFEIMIEDEWFSDEKLTKEKNEGFRLFYEHYEALWN